MRGPEKNTERSAPLSRQLQAAQRFRFAMAGPVENGIAGAGAQSLLASPYR
jgi:hypothetical protein